MVLNYCGVNGFHVSFVFQIGAGLYAVGRPVQKRNDEDGQIGTIQSLALERGALFNRFFGEPAHGPPHVAGGASGPILTIPTTISTMSHPSTDVFTMVTIATRPSTKASSGKPMSMAQTNGQSEWPETQGW